MQIAEAQLEIWGAHSGKLFLILPGSSGLGNPMKPGYALLACSAWKCGWDVAFCRTSGQDGIKGGFSLSRWLTESEATVKEWIRRTGSTRWAVFGASAGGAIAANLAARLPDCHGAVIFETPLQWTSEMQEDVRKNSESHGICLADDFFETIVNLDGASPTCRVRILYSTADSTTFNPKELAKVRQRYPQWTCRQIDGTDHGLWRRGSPEQVEVAVTDIEQFLLRT